MSKRENELQIDEPTMADRGTDGNALPDRDGDRAEANTVSAGNGGHSEVDELPDQSPPDRTSASRPVTESKTLAGDGRQQADGYAVPADQGVTAGVGDGDETARSDKTTGVTGPADGSADTADGVVDAERAAGIRRRVREATGTFVDQPRHALEEMDTLFDEVNTLFTDGLAARRAGLRRILAADGSTSDTEELRLAVQEYRHLVEVLIEA